MSRQVLASRLIARHRFAWQQAYRSLWHAPITGGLTILVIAFSLAVPVVFWLILDNIKTLAGDLRTHTRITVFVRHADNDQHLQRLLAEFKQLPQVASLDYETPEQALGRLQPILGVGDLKSYLPDNPLPGVIHLYPQATLATPEDLQPLLTRLRLTPDVEAVTSDAMVLANLISLSKALHWIGTLLMLAAVTGIVLTVAYSSHLLAENARDEIALMDLLGGTRACIRRPFLYAGISYGFLGSILAVCLVGLLQAGLSGSPLQFLVQYFPDFRFYGLSLAGGMGLIAVATLLGLVAAWVAVSRALNELIALNQGY